MESDSYLVMAREGTRARDGFEVREGVREPRWREVRGTSPSAGEPTATRRAAARARVRVSTVPRCHRTSGMTRARAIFFIEGAAPPLIVANPRGRAALHTGSRVATPSSASDVRQPRHASAPVAMFVPPPTAALSERQAQQSRGYVLGLILLIMFLSSQDFAPLEATRGGGARARRASRATATRSGEGARARDTRRPTPRFTRARSRHRPTLSEASNLACTRAPRVPRD